MATPYMAEASRAPLLVPKQQLYQTLRDLWDRQKQAREKQLPGHRRNHHRRVPRVKASFFPLPRRAAATNQPNIPNRMTKRNTRRQRQPLQTIHPAANQSHRVATLVTNHPRTTSHRTEATILTTTPARERPAQAPTDRPMVRITITRTRTRTRTPARE